MDFVTLLTRLAVALALVALATLAVRFVLQRRHRPVRRPIDEATLATEYLPIAELRRSRLFIYVRRDQMGGETPATVVIAGYYTGTDEFHAVEDVPLQPLSDWQEGQIGVQEAFPAMPVADRHFISTGSKWANCPGN